MSRALVVVAVLGVAVVSLRSAWNALLGAPGGPTWQAEFTDARGLVPGNDVRVDGAVVGRVTSITLDRDGSARVSFRLSAPAGAPRADAGAAIEPADLLGDTYLSLSPGSSPAPLRGAIPTARTVNAPRLDQVLDAFTPQVRDGLQVLLIDGGYALDGHGSDLARATVALRPALSAAQRVLSELDSQDGSLATLVPVAERAAAQLDARRGDLGPLLDGLARAVEATASASRALDTGLAGLPGLLAQARGTARALSDLTATARPVVTRLDPVVGSLGAAVAGLPGLARRVTAAAPALSGALSQARTALSAGGRGFSELSAAFPTLRAQAPALAQFMTELDAAAPGIAQGFFVDFPDQAAESGRQPFDPFADPRRAYWRGAAVFSCEAFGVPVAPGCLSRALANLARQRPPAPSPSGRSRQRPTVPVPATSPLRRLLPQLPAALPVAPVLQAPAAPLQGASSLLHFLLGR